jgi:hypothetical protein
MNKSTNMSNTGKSGETGRYRDQVARNLLQEARRVEARIQMEEDVDEVTTKQEIQLVGVEMQDFIIEKN